jgi:hypothetical protein
MEPKVKGAWLIHHTNKLEKFNKHAGLDDVHTAGKCGKLLSAITESEREATVNKETLRVLADECRINKLEQDSIITLLKNQHLVDTDSKGNIRTRGVTQAAVLQKTADIFDNCEPSNQEIASLELSELISDSPTPENLAKEQIADKFKLSKSEIEALFNAVEQVKIVDSESIDNEKLLFNGNLFKKEGLKKTTAVLDSLSSNEQLKVVELNDLIDKQGCLAIDEAHRIIGQTLFAKLVSISLYEVNVVSNSTEAKYFITKTISFSKFGNPLIDDALDSAKALVTSLAYGILYSNSQRGQIMLLELLIDKLISGRQVGSAPAIGEDYRALEMKGVVKITKDTTKSNHFFMRLLKKDVGILAKEVLMSGGATGTLLLSNLKSSAHNYGSPEFVREQYRAKSNLIEDNRAIAEKLSVIRSIR